MGVLRCVVLLRAPIILSANYSYFSFIILSVMSSCLTARTLRLFLVLVGTKSWHQTDYFYRDNGIKKFHFRTRTLFSYSKIVKKKQGQRSVA